MNFFGGVDMVLVDVELLLGSSYWLRRYVVRDEKIMIHVVIVVMLLLLFDDFRRQL
jgi:hypothetical protein